MTDTRQDGNAYIDLAVHEQTEEAINPTRLPEAASDSGSSVEEDEEDEAPTWDPSTSSLASEDENEAHTDGEDEWDVDDEDWELADGGKLLVRKVSLIPDFTKHYNRVRQQHAAVTAPGSARPPLPSRNLNVAAKTPAASSKKMFNPSLFTGGVAANPKAAGDKHDKDKSDRATQEQVLDARTRLVLSGLVNRGIFSRLEGCISTGKEVGVCSYILRFY